VTAEAAEVKPVRRVAPKINRNQSLEGRTLRARGEYWGSATSAAEFQPPGTPGQQQRLPMLTSIGFVYLARASEPEQSVRAFIESYQRHPAGTDHDLVVIYKGGDKHRHLFGDLEHHAVVVVDTGLDITAYLNFAAQDTHRTLCFANTHTVLQCDGWLQHLSNGLIKPVAGLVGATASYESIATSWALMSKIIWMVTNGQPFDQNIAAHFSWYIKQHAPEWLERRVMYGQPPSEDAWQIFWASLQESGKPFQHMNRFPKFPNPHIRTNVFMIERERLLAFNFGPIETKDHALAFESGRDSLTTRVINAGMKPLLVDSKGDTFPIPEWKNSKTFRLGDQQDLINTDNQSEAWMRLGRTERDTYTMMSWGRDAVRDGSNPPTLGLYELGDDRPLSEPFFDPRFCGTSYKYLNDAAQI
jgi:hypothetical protein